MNEKIIERFRNKISKKVPQHEALYFSKRLYQIENEDDLKRITNTYLRSPLFIWLISLGFGNLGLDRLLLKNYKFGLIKMFTAGGFGILWIIDLFLIKKAQRESNIRKLEIVWTGRNFD